MNHELKDCIDKTKLQDLLRRFRAAVRRRVDRGLADEIEYQIIQCGRTMPEIATTKKLARWCNTNGDPYKDAMPLAAEWRAGQFRLYEQRKTKKVALSYATRWSNADAARRYMDAYRRVLAGKWTDLRVDSESGDTVVGFGGGARFELKLSGDTVVSQEGLPEGTLKQ